MKPTSADDKPTADQAPLQQLLSAAYVVQQHHERLQAGQPPETGYSQILKEILEVQEQLRGSHLESREKAALIARRVRQMTQASGCAVGMVKEDQLEYYAATGSAASQAGACVPRESSLAHECLRTGQLLQSPTAETDSRLSPELCRALGVKALIAVPVKYENKIAGVLELHFAEANSFHEEEIRVCQLMSVLVAEGIVKPPGPHPEQPVQRTAPAEPSNIKDAESLLAALEKIRPKLEHLARNPGMASIAPPAGSPSLPIHRPDPDSPATTTCRACGHRMTEDEIFCGLCGSPRQPQRIWSSLLELQKKAENSAQGHAGSAAGDDAFDSPLDVFPSELEDIVAKFSGEGFPEAPSKSAEVSLPSFAEELVSGKVPSPEERPDENYSAQQPDEESAVQEQIAASPTHAADSVGDAGRPFLIEKSPQSAPLAADAYPPFSGFASDTSLLSLPAEVPQETLSSGAAPENQSPPWTPTAGSELGSLDGNAPWGSAAKTKKWLEVQRENSAWLTKKWQQQRANIYLMAAALLLVGVLLGWGSPSQPLASSRTTAGADHAHRADAAPQPDLSPAEKLLIYLGLAEAPAAEVADPGNPDAQVWVDVHTALYYCSGADLYGKTPGGKTITQREAQQDQFQPALRKACQ